ncbi:MAG TPA: MBL fold metallo-hydrolase [Solirubrobacterales bacterium]
MEIRRLAWAGLEVNAGGETAVVDFVEDFSWMHDDPPAGEIPPSPAAGTAVAGLLTHLHWDHADVDALGRVLSPAGVVLRPEKSFGSQAEVALIDKPESELEQSGLTTRVVQPWETVEIGPFSCTALPAADGFGDPQVSWCIAADGCRILHTGDTLFPRASRQAPCQLAWTQGRRQSQQRSLAQASSCRSTTGAFTKPPTTFSPRILPEASAQQLPSSTSRPECSSPESGSQFKPRSGSV